MGVANFKVRGKLDSAGAEKEGTLTIDRESGKVTVRPKRSRIVYELPLSQVASYVCRVGFQSNPGAAENVDE